MGNEELRAEFERIYGIVRQAFADYDLDALLDQERERELRSTLEKVGEKFYFKNDGQNPNASFKDRGMASAFSYINFLVKNGLVKDVLAICASTGDTSAAAALYAAYLQPLVKSAVLLPHKKVTPQQLSQPLGSGAAVFEVPGVFDDCMKVVEALSERYNVALLNSKNAGKNKITLSPV